MAKPDATLLDPERYPFSCEIATRFGDLDVNLHVNNVALVGILEEARVRFHRASGYHAALAEGGPGMSSMVASISIEYLGQGFHPDPLEVHVAPQRIGNTSYGLCQLVLQSERTVAYAEAVMVIVRDGRPTAIPDSYRTSVKPWLLRP
jgi:acyl-CoA thioester hydrolase